MGELLCWDFSVQETRENSTNKNAKSISSEDDFFRCFNSSLTSTSSWTAGRPVMARHYLVLVSDSSTRSMSVSERNFCLADFLRRKQVGINFRWPVPVNLSGIAKLDTGVTSTKSFQAINLNWDAIQKFESFLSILKEASVMNLIKNSNFSFKHFYWYFLHWLRLNFCSILLRIKMWNFRLKSLINQLKHSSRSFGWWIQSKTKANRTQNCVLLI